MPVSLNKTITRWVKIGGEDYKLILEPPTETDTQATISLIKKGARDSEGTSSLEDLLEWLATRFDTTSSKQDSMVKSLKKAKGSRYDSISYKDMLSRVGALHIKLADQLREIVDDIYEVNCLASDLSDEQLVKKGIDPLN
jgi:hypothetical protein